MEVLKNLQATGLKRLDSIKFMDVNIFTVLLSLLLISGAAVTGVLMSQEDGGNVDIPGLSQKSNTDPISKGVTAIDNDIANLQSSKETMSLGKFRAESQDIQQRITETWMEAGRASGMSEEEAARNGKYVLYLSSAAQVVTSMQAGEDPELSTYKTLFRELTGKDSRLIP